MTTVFSILASGLLSLLVLACTAQPENGGEKPVPSRDITTVMNAHVDSLMNVAGVVGVYIGEQADRTPVIRVMVREKNEEVLKSIPAELEGYPVEIEESGEITPMK